MHLQCIYNAFTMHLPCIYNACTMQCLQCNPNAFTIQAADVDIALYAGEERIGSVSLRGTQKLQGRSETLLSLYVVSDPGALRKLVQNQLFQFISGGDVELRAVGEVTGRAFGLNVTIPVEATEQIQFQL